jgi:hypothetical protein
VHIILVHPVTSLPGSGRPLGSGALPVSARSTNWRCAWRPMYVRKSRVKAPHDLNLGTGWSSAVWNCTRRWMGPKAGLNVCEEARLSSAQSAAISTELSRPLATSGPVKPLLQALYCKHALRWRWLPPARAMLGSEGWLGLRQVAFI